MRYALAALLSALLLLILVWMLWVAIGLRAASQNAGTIRLSGLDAPVRIVRDERDIPHIYASTQHDLMFAQGYAEASDRLFQMDLLRRYVYGRLAEVLGPGVLSADENARICDIRDIVAQQWAHLGVRDRRRLQAFAQGVNAAMNREPLPPEFHILLYKPRPWMPQDTLAVGMATVLDLIDPWDDVIRRDAIARDKRAAPLLDLYSITDPAYDAPIDGTAIEPVPPLAPAFGKARRGSDDAAALLSSAADRQQRVGDRSGALALPGARCSPTIRTCG